MEVTLASLYCLIMWERQLCVCERVYITGCLEVDDSSYVRLNWMMLKVRLQAFV